MESGDKIKHYPARALWLLLPAGITLLAAFGQIDQETQSLFTGLLQRLVNIFGRWAEFLFYFFMAFVSLFPFFELAAQAFLKLKDFALKKEHLPITAYFLLVLCLFLFIFKKSSTIRVDSSDGTIYAHESDWWGLSVKQKNLKWMSLDKGDSSAWYTKNNKGKWVLYYRPGLELGADD